MMDCLNPTGRSAAPYITRSLLLLVASLLLACDGQAPSQINSDAYADQAPPSPQQQAEAIGQVLGIEQAKPALNEAGEALLEVHTPPLMYSDGGLLLDLDGQVTVNGDAQISQTLWRQTAGPQAQLLNPGRPQAQVIVPRVTTATHLEFTLMAADSHGHVAEAQTRIRILPPAEANSPELAQVVARYNAVSVGAGQINVTLSLPEPPSAPITLHYTTQDGTAIAGQDYRAAHGQVTLDADNPEALIPIEVLNDAVVDGDIYFRLLYSPDPTSIPNQIFYVVLSAQGEQVSKPGEPSEPEEPGEPSEPTEPTDPSEPTPTSYSLTYTASSGGRIDGDTQQNLPAGDPGSAVTAIPDPGYVFIGWSDGQTGAQRTDAPEADHRFYAQFRRAELWMASGHSGDLSVTPGPTTATVTWLAQTNVVYNLIVAHDPLTELDNYSAFGAELMMDVAPPLRLEDLTTDQPVYLALEADGELQGWTSFVPKTLGTDSVVSAQAIAPDGTRYVGGNFTFVGPATGGGVALPANPEQSAYPLAGAHVEGAVYSAVPDQQGGWYLGGNFGRVNGRIRQNLAHINAAGQLTEWNPGANGMVWTLAIDQQVIYAGGAFTQADGQARSRLAAFDAQGQLLPWNPEVDSSVRTLVIDQGVVYAGGSFTQAGGEARASLVAFDVEGQLLSWNPGANDWVSTLVVDQGVIYAGGSFTQAGGESRAHVAAFDPQGQLLSWNPGANWTVYSLVVDQGVIYAGGGFTPFGGMSRGGLVAFDAQGQTLSWKPGASGGLVYTLAVERGVIYVGGGFSEIGGESRAGLAAFDTQGQLLPWNPGVNSSVSTLAMDQGVIYVGGWFTQAGGESRTRLAAFDPRGQLLPWNPGASGGSRNGASVSTLAVDEGVIYAGGWFTQAGGESRAHMAAFDTQGQLLPWNPGADSWVGALAVNQGLIYAGGSFTQAGGESRTRLAAFDTQGQLLPWNPGAIGGSVGTLTVDQGVIYAGGGFTQAGGEFRARLAAFDAQGQLLPWNPGASDGSRPGSLVGSLVVDQGVIYVGGGFTQAGGEPRDRLAAFDTQGQLLPWNPGADSWVGALAVNQGLIYAGGSFTQAGGESRTGLAAFDTQGQLLPWNPGVIGGSVGTLTVDQGVIYAGGGFTQAGGEFRARLAAFDLDGNLLQK